MTKKTSVVNIRNPKLGLLNLNQKIWPEHFVYIGRSERGLCSKFGNPCKLHSKCPICKKYHHLPQSTIPCYEKYLRQRIKDDPNFASAVKNLYGKTLVCWCKPKQCHGDILAKVATELSQN